MFTECLLAHVQPGDIMEEEQGKVREHQREPADNTHQGADPPQHDDAGLTPDLRRQVAQSNRPG
ncbi:MAG: hypothetical protein ACYSU2_15505, partial [Planctomycetota bacterium]